jgi:hypothetical protein
VKASELESVGWFAGSPPRRQLPGSSRWYAEELRFAKMQGTILMTGVA